MTAFLLNGTCNAIVHDTPNDFLGEIAREANGTLDGILYVGDKLLDIEPIAVVTRQSDREFSDVVNWAINSMKYGEAKNITKDDSLCNPYEKNPSVFDLDFMNAVYCVGNYAELWRQPRSKQPSQMYPIRRAVNELNNGTHLLYSPPFGDLVDEEAVPAVGLLAEVRNANNLNCGVMVSTNFTGNTANANMVEGVSVIMCRTMAAAILNGNHNRVNLFLFDESDKVSAYAALMNGTIGKASLLVGRLQTQAYTVLEL